MCKLRNMSVLLLAVLLLLCAGCGKQTSVPTEPPTSATAAAPTETTAPPQTDPPPQPLPHPDVPLLLRQSMERLCASGDRSVDIVERIYSEADRLTRTQEASFHTSGTGEDFRYCLDNSILTQAGKDAALVEVDENLSGDTLQLTVSGKKETKTVDAELREQCEDYLERRVFQNALSATVGPDPAGAADFAAWLADYRRLLPARNQAADAWNS